MARFKRLSEQREGRPQRHPHSPEHRNADNRPGKHHLGVEPIRADAEGACRPGIDGRRFRLQRRDLVVRREPLVGKRLDQRIGDQPECQHAGENIHGAGLARAQAECCCLPSGIRHFGLLDLVGFRFRFADHGNGLKHERIQAVSLLLENFEQLPPHPRLPEFIDMIGDALRGLACRLALEECGDLICHIDELGLGIMRHRRCFRARCGAGG
ncbi:hypothetical protein RHECNPAF_7500110 [Rhizobium etli CNPAF512]|nr:hypothetical protein RHECNPAF_7500110 [Rhizobium etli CNPAF512]